MLTDMRSFLERLEEADDLVHVTRPVSPEFEIAAGIRRTSSIDGPALWFDDVRGHEMPVVGGLYSSLRRIHLGLEADREHYFDRVLKGFAHPIAPETVEDAPCQEVVVDGDDASFHRLPICTHNELDVAPFVTMGVQFARHPVHGPNACISRMQILDERLSGMVSIPPQHLGLYFVDAESRGEPLQVAVAIGNDPYVTMASQVAGPIDLDEMTIAGGWMGEPVRMVRCVTIDVEVPATSEIVLEGELLPGERRREGPFGEVTGFYSPPSEQPVFRLKAMTHRRDPIYLTGLTGEPSTDNHVMRQGIHEPLLFGRLRDICHTIHDVCLTRATGGAHVVISMTPQYKTQARDVMMAALLGGKYRPKVVIVVDEDVDPRDPAQVEWATAYRVQPDRDVVIVPRMRGVGLDPSVPEPGVGAVMGIDATKGASNWERTAVPGAETFEIPGWTDFGR
jgi:4-hydroxy-3-polyprenylbenzoate decarboxylase/2,5-furandicarboxylate decarboxylase 1